ncbi:unnamed protein product [Prunus brigantina]
MGFHHLYAYNIALLAKQGWRFIHNPDSLARMLFKAKYFPTTSLWAAVAGPGASHCWRRSLMHGLCLLVVSNGWWAMVAPSASGGIGGSPYLTLLRLFLLLLSFWLICMYRT